MIPLPVIFLSEKENCSVTYMKTNTRGDNMAKVLGERVGEVLYTLELTQKEVNTIRCLLGVASDTYVKGLGDDRNLEVVGNVYDLFKVFESIAK
jgi:hypothetical protein